MKDTQSCNRLYRLSAFATTPARPATFTGPNMTRTFKNPVRCAALVVVLFLAVARGELTLAQDLTNDSAIGPPPRLRFGTVRSLLEDSKGNYWFGSWNEGVC